MVEIVVRYILYFLSERNIFHNFIPNALIYDDKDFAWMNDEIKTLIKRKNWLYYRQKRSGNLHSNMLITTDISNAVNYSKLRHHYHLAKKLNDPKTAAKTNWSIFKTFIQLVNRSNISLIPLLLVGNRFVTVFLAKTNLFNDFFSKQISKIFNKSSLPKNLTFETENRLLETLRDF